MALSCIIRQRLPTSAASRVASSRTLPIVRAAAAAPAEDKKTQTKYHPSPLSTAAPSTYAVVEIGGNQLFVEEGKWYNVNRLNAEVGSQIKLGRVLALKEQGKFTAGRPYLENATVEAKLLEECRGPKILVFKMKPKKHYRRKRGHRQDLTKLQITKISSS
ncbi:plastid/chloroplast ribosomal protein L21 [Dunaliella salina]|uniref:Plastid/chloroplast ribosomal protein L21 n=1 Tax=Dunaliella salina TaxID=3046 RepID=A0ABQ7GYV0_DUNSA|nr:plastid/chloroplast ribosomal protein L21 [Dunaliella salina]|eukprot:KAF5839775.1 plastid/chloroplast ribosomal protein L21 [Dunaliella salina]